MKRSRTVRNTLDDLFCHDSLLEEQDQPSSQQTNDENEWDSVGLYLEDLEENDEVKPPSKLMKRNHDGDSSPSSEQFIPDYENLIILPYSDVNECDESTEVQVQGDQADSVLDSCTLSSITNRLSRFSGPRKSKSGVEDLTLHFMTLLGGQSTFVL